MSIYFSSIFTLLAIATKPYAHKNGSHNGMMPNSEFLVNVSTPVLMKRYSDIVMAMKPKTKKSASCLPLLIEKAIVIIRIKTHVSI
mgnify:CR=1 FL=1